MEEMEISLESVGTERLENAKYMVVGRIIADKILNRIGVLSILKGLWSEEMVFSIREMGLNRYSIEIIGERMVILIEVEDPMTMAGWVENCDKEVEMSSAVPHRQRFGAHLRVGLIRKKTIEVREKGGVGGYQGNKEIKKGILGGAKGIDEREEVAYGEKMYQERKEAHGKEVVREVEMWRC
ncbi:hypothetical protein CRYUN_Cryun27aG0016700 [Craigia yunnanensis]